MLKYYYKKNNLTHVCSHDMLDFPKALNRLKGGNKADIFKLVISWQINRKVLPVQELQPPLCKCIMIYLNPPEDTVTNQLI